MLGTLAWLAMAGAAQPLGAQTVKSIVTGQTAVESSTIVIPEELSAEQVDTLLARLTDAQVRQLLSRQLHKTAEGNASAGGATAGGLGVLLVKLRLGLEGMADNLRRQSARLSNGLMLLPGALATSIDKVAGGLGYGGFLIQIGYFLGLLALGTAAYLGVRRLTASRRSGLEDPADTGFGARVCAAALCAAFNLLAIAAFALVTIGVAAMLFDQQDPDRTFVVTFLTGALIVHGTALVSRFLLAPHAPALRLLALPDGAARFLHRWFVRIAGVATFAWLLAGLLILTGMPLAAHLIIVLMTGAIVAAMLLIMIVQSRAAVAAAIRGGGSPGDSLRAQFADTWHVFATLYIVVIWVLWAMTMLAQGRSTIWAAIVSVGIVLLFPVVDRAIGRVLVEMFDAGGGAAKRSTYRAVLQRGVRLVVAAVLGVVVLQIWGVNLTGETGAMAEDVLLDASLDFAVAVLLAYLGWQLVKVGIDRKLVAREVDGVMVEPSPRMKTLLPLARKFILAVLGVMTVMLILSAAGVNIAPLLAGAGVVGIAVGFGAQSLVRDIMSGIFFLVEDAFRVGEYIEMGELRGEVETISLRSLRLRHHRGAIHTIPYGELRSITNYNRDWVIYKMNFRVPFDTDIDKVKKLIKAVGKEMMADQELGKNLLEPLKSQGVTEIDDSGLVIRVKFMSKPREQFILRREAYKRIQAAFAANGIEFARRKVEVHAPRDTAEEAEAAAAALVADQATAGAQP
jgi:small-conductance mechanosensitive channel